MDLLVALHFFAVDRRSMAKLLPTRHLTQINQSINQSINQ